MQSTGTTARAAWGETAMGLVVLALAAVFLVYSLGVSGAGRVGGGYTLLAKFGDAGGMTPGSKVTIGGVKVGSVTRVTLDPKNFMAVIAMSIDGDVRIPSDSSAKITSDGLLGGAHIALAPGGAADNLKAGDEIGNTQGSVDLFGMIGQFLRPHPAGGDAAPSASSSAAPAAAASAGSADSLPAF